MWAIANILISCAHLTRLSSLFNQETMLLLRSFADYRLLHMPMVLTVPWHTNNRFSIRTLGTDSVLFTFAFPSTSIQSTQMLKEQKFPFMYFGWKPIYDRHRKAQPQRKGHKKWDFLADWSFFLHCLPSPWSEGIHHPAELTNKSL